MCAVRLLFSSGKTHGSRYFKTTLLLFMMLLSLPVMAAGIFAYISQLRDNRMQRETTYQNAIQDIAKSIDAEFESLSTLAIQLERFDWVSKYMNASAITHAYAKIDQLELQRHIEELTDSTISANARFFENEGSVPKRSITMGMGDIMNAKRILLVVYGESKRDVLKQLLDGSQVTPRNPATFLLLHHDVTIICEKPE